MRQFVGIEVGGTKLQLGLGNGESAGFLGLWRGQVEARDGAEAIRRMLLTGFRELLTRAGIRAEDVAGIGVAFGGPVDATAGVTLISHQVAGWENFPLAQWLHDQLGLPVTLQNDADTAAFAEARFGAGRGFDPVLYITVGSGIGGGLVSGGRIYRGSGAGAVEIGHLRPGHLPRHMPSSGGTVESVASGFGISDRARRAIRDWEGTLDYVQSKTSPHRTALDPAYQTRFSATRGRFARLLDLAGGDVDRITTNLIAEAARGGDALSLELLSDATQILGWAVAQAITLLNPARIVIGGGVSLIGEELFFEPVRRACRAHVFEPFADMAEIVPARLGEEVVVHGAVALAANAAVAN